jgi:hypothetical protein
MKAREYQLVCVQKQRHAQLPINRKEESVSVYMCILSCFMLLNSDPFHQLSILTKVTTGIGYRRSTNLIPLAPVQNHRPSRTGATPAPSPRHRCHRLALHGCTSDFPVSRLVRPPCPALVSRGARRLFLGELALFECHLTKLRKKTFLSVKIA